MIKIHAASWLVLLLAILLLGCSSQGGGGGGSVTFTVSPMNMGDYKTVGPLGNLNPRMGHCLPSDHGGFAFMENTAGLYYDVYAPASGTIDEITYTENNWPDGSGQTGTYRDWTVRICHTFDFYSIFGHLSTLEGSILAQAGTLQPNVPNVVSIPVSAGQHFASCGGRPGVVTGIDWYVLDYRLTKDFIHLNRYGRTRYAAHFIDYVTSTIRNQYLPLIYDAEATPIVTREASPIGGKIDFDVSGKLSGNWFHETTTATEAANSQYNKQLAFVYDKYEPTKLRIAFGGPEGTVGSSTVSTPLGLHVTTYQVENNTPDPANVEVASGEVVYWLQGLEINGEQTIEATLLVKLNGAETASVEGFSGHILSPAFTENVQNYIR